MRRQYDLAVKIDEYITHNGDTKARWENIGVVMLNDDNKPFMLLKRTFNPSGVKNTDDKNNIMINMFPPKEDRQNSRGSYPPASDNPFDDEPYYGGNGGRNDDVPF